MITRDDLEDLGFRDHYGVWHYQTLRYDPEANDRFQWSVLCLRRWLHLLYEPCDIVELTRLIRHIPQQESDEIPW